MESHKISANLIKLGFFTPADIFHSFGVNFLDESVCRHRILERLHPDYVMCPGCKAEITGKVLQNFWEGKRIRCRAEKCGKFFTALTGTFLSGCHLDYRGMILLAIFLHLGIRNELIADKLAVSVETVRLWQKKYESIEQARKIIDAEVLHGD